MAETDPPRKIEQVEILPIDDTFAVRTRTGVVLSKGADSRYGAAAYWMVADCSSEGESFPAFQIPAEVRMGGCGSGATAVTFRLKKARYNNTEFICADDLRLAPMA